MFRASMLHLLTGSTSCMLYLCDPLHLPALKMLTCSSLLLLLLPVRVMVLLVGTVSTLW